MSNEQEWRSDGAALGPPSADILQRFDALMSEMPEPFSSPGENTTPHPKPGQFWTARWDGLSTAVLLVSSPSSRTVSVALVTFDTDFADDHAHLLPAGATDLNTPAVVWIDDAGRVPLAVLDAYLGELSSTPGWDQSQAVAQLVAEVGERGWPISRPSDRRATFRASLLDELAALMQASWLTASESVNGDELVSERSPSELAKELGISISEALSIKRRTFVPTPEQLEAWSQLQAADASPSLMHSAELPAAVIDLFDQPRYRQKVARLAELRDLEENLARRTFAYNVLSTAARKTGDDRSDEVNREFWRQRIDQFFAVQFEDLGEEE